MGVPNWHYKIFRFNHSGTNVCRRSRVLHIYLYTICLPQKGFLVAFTQSKTMENVGEISNYSPKMCVCRLQRILMCLSHRMVCVQNYDFFCCHEVSICCTMVSGFCLMYGWRLVSVYLYLSLSLFQFSILLLPFLLLLIFLFERLALIIVYR